MSLNLSKVQNLDSEFLFYHIISILCHTHLYYLVYLFQVHNAYLNDLLLDGFLLLKMSQLGTLIINWQFQCINLHLKFSIFQIKIYYNSDIIFTFILKQSLPCMLILTKIFIKIFYFIIYFRFRMRPQTPIPNGCSFSLLTFRLNFARPPLPYTQGSKTNRPDNIQSKKYLTKKDKFSLKKPCQNPFQSFDNYQLSKMANSGIQNQMQNFFQFSSIDKHKNSRKESNIRYKPENIYNNNAKSSYSTQRGTQRTSLRPQKQNQTKNQFINVTQTNVFTDEITLNQQSGYHQIKRNQSMIGSTLHHRQNQRRIHTDNNQIFIVNQKYLIEDSGRHNPQVTKSQFFNENNFLHRSPTVSTLKKDALLSNQSQKKIQILQNSTVKKNSFFEAKIQPVVLPHQSVEKIPANQISNQLQISHEVSNVPLFLVNQSHDTHSTRKQYSPKFEKKFKTLVDLTYKNVSSSGGDKTSSNHISIVASQDSIHQTNFGKSSDQFSKKIKMMTLKSMPLKQEIWSMSLTKE